MKYKICSLEMQDGRWSVAFAKPPSFNGQSVTISEPAEVDVYFSTKAEADNYTLEFLKGKGIKEEDIEIK